MPELTEPTPAKKLELETQAAQNLAKEHAESLKELHGQVQGPEDEAVLNEWLNEGEQLRLDAGHKAVQASLDRPTGQVFQADGAWRIMTKKETQEFSSGVDRSPPVGGRVG